MVPVVGLDLRCGEGRLGLKRAPGTFPSALGFESLQTIRIAALQRSAAILVISKQYRCRQV